MFSQYQFIAAFKMYYDSQSAQNRQTHFGARTNFTIWCRCTLWKICLRTLTYFVQHTLSMFNKKSCKKHKVNIRHIWNNYANNCAPLGPRCVWEPSICATGGFSAGLSGRRAKSEIPRLRAQCSAWLCQIGLQLRVRPQHTQTQYA